MSRAAPAVRRHWVFGLLVIAAVALRVVTGFAYRPVVFGITDTFEYLYRAEHLTPGEVHPIGYAFFLRVLPLDLGLWIVPLVQHALGVLTAALLYAVLVRLGVRTWVAALAAAPILLDAWILNVEHQILGETVFHLLVMGACAALLWRRPLGVPAAGLAGLCLAAAALTRPIGAVLIAPAFVVVLLLPARRRRALTALALVALFALTLGAYAVWVHSALGVYGLNSVGGRFLYGRVAEFADCSQLSVPPLERPLCTTESAGRPPDPYELMWGSRSPVRELEPPPGGFRDDLTDSFAKRVIRGQPLDYAGAVIGDFVAGFEPTRTADPGEWRVDPWRFQADFPTFFRGTPCPGSGASELAVEGCLRRAGQNEATVRAYGGSGGEANRDLAGFLQAYSRFAYLPGPLLLAGLVLALLAAAGVGRARRSELRVPALLFAGFALALSLGSAATAIFSWRYQLPQLVLLPAAAALALTALTTRAEVAAEPRQEPEPVC